VLALYLACLPILLLFLALLVHLLRNPVPPPP
jgi:hypothetical protein